MRRPTIVEKICYLVANSDWDKFWLPTPDQALPLSKAAFKQESATKTNANNSLCCRKKLAVDKLRFSWQIFPTRSQKRSMEQLLRGYCTNKVWTWQLLPPTPFTHLNYLHAPNADSTRPTKLIVGMIKTRLILTKFVIIIKC